MKLRIGGIIKAYKILVGNNKGKGQLETCRCQQDNNIKVDLQQIPFLYVSSSNISE
jgi:hypothetical protein